jgi:DNA-directed RNA polymerase subunit N (RpoN/RPB10)
MKNTIKNKYGVDHFSKSKKFVEKIKKTWNEKTQEEISQINEKLESINLKKYNCRRPIQNKEIKEKIHKTNLEKYGYKNVFQSNQIK